ncbi:Hypothetical predicted protein, partial [Mytilus galloprovincialis]
MEKNLFDDFEKRVDDEINFHIDKTISQRRRTRVDGIVESILSDIDRKYGKDMKFQDMKDEDEINALHHQLKTEEIKARLKEISDQLSNEGKDFIPKGQSYGFLRAYQHLPETEIQEESKRLQKALDTIFVADIVKKYSVTTKISVIKTYDKDALR